MRSDLRKLIIIVTFCCLTYAQPAQLIAKSNQETITDTVITAIDYTSDISAAQITAPTTFPLQDERKADSTFLMLNEMFFEDRSYLHVDPPKTLAFESSGFIYVQHYQSSYLPIHI